MQTSELTERDSAGRVQCTYILSSQGSANPLYVDRIEVLRPRLRWVTWSMLRDAFLPIGFPQSVTEDYVPYQIYDSIQAVASSIAGLLSNRAVLEGVGVGDADASTTMALLYSVIQDSAGRVATIVFAQRFATSLEPECKRYRLLADILNDFAMILDCLSPIFSKPSRVLTLSGGSMLRALCGLTAGSSKASLSAHFARRGNLAELNAKDSSQETVISLFGMLAGSIVVSHIETTYATWATLLLLLAIHLVTNYFAVRAVTLETLNRQRATILFTTMLDEHTVLSPRQVADRERVFAAGSSVSDKFGKCIGTISLGVSLERLIKQASSTRSKTAFKSIDSSFETILTTFQNERYVMTHNERQKHVCVVFKQHAAAQDQMQAWLHGMITLRAGDYSSRHKDVPKLTATLQVAKKLLIHHAPAMRAKGWNLEVVPLETTAGFRLNGL